MARSLFMPFYTHTHNLNHYFTVAFYTIVTSLNWYMYKLVCLAAVLLCSTIVHCLCLHSGVSCQLWRKCSGILHIIIWNVCILYCLFADYLKKWRRDICTEKVQWSHLSFLYIVSNFYAITLPGGRPSFS